MSQTGRVTVTSDDGTTHEGRYEVTGRMVYVFYAGHRKVTQIGGMPVEFLAQQLLSEMVRGQF